MWIQDLFGEFENHQHKTTAFCFSLHSDYQFIEIVETPLYGKVMLIDGRTQSSERDEFIYHEGIVHPAMLTHTAPQRVLCIGGGNGGVLRELVKYSSLKHIVLVEIDPQIVALSRQWLPFMSQGAFEDPRVRVIYQDGRQYLADTPQKFDVVILDLPEPLPNSPPCRLFTREFYTLLHSRLTEHGVLALQGGPANPCYLTLYLSVLTTLRTVFANVQPYTLYSPFFAIEWGLALCTVNAETTLPLPPSIIEQRLQERLTGDLRFYDSMTHQRIFALPKHLRAVLNRQGRPITDDSLLYRFDDKLEAVQDAIPLLQ